VIAGAITPDGVPVVTLLIAGGTWPAVIDTGFNGDLELPTSLEPFANARFFCRNRSLLAAGQFVDEDTYLVEFPFEGQTCLAEATFVPGSEILIGTHFLGHYRLEINFHAGSLVLERVGSA
jgi:predicted aspartyl protease